MSSEPPRSIAPSSQREPAAFEPFGGEPSVTPFGAGPAPLAGVRGVSRLAADAVVGVTEIVETMHHTIATVSPIVGVSASGQRRGGISGLVYRSIRGISRTVGVGLDTALAPLTPLLRHRRLSPRRAAAVAALNGVLGDHLAATENTLAIPMQLRQQGQPLVLHREALSATPASRHGRLLVLAHGLCMSDLSWTREGHDHGAALAHDLGFTPLYLHYNSGRRIPTNGQEFADLLEQLVRAWPVRVSELVLVGHSMGGLIARSACHHAVEADHTWLHCLSKLVCLGTPHYGAPLERAGSLVEALLNVSPYSAPFARVGGARSAGIRDLRWGTVLDEAGREDSHAMWSPEPLPGHIGYYTVAATTLQEPQASALALPGDGLVPVDSALGRHRDPARSLPIPDAHRAVCYGTNHFGLLSSREAYEHLHRWLASA